MNAFKANIMGEKGREGRLKLRVSIYYPYTILYSVQFAMDREGIVSVYFRRNIFPLKIVANKMKNWHGLKKIVAYVE